MASPLIFRPVKRNNGYYGMIAVLRAQPPSGLRLHFDQPPSNPIPPLLVSRPDLRTYSNAPIAKARSGVDPIEAFLEHARSQGFK